MQCTKFKATLLLVLLFLLKSTSLLAQDKAEINESDIVMPESESSTMDPVVTQVINKFSAKLEDRISSFAGSEDWQSIEWIKAKLAHMVEVDQFMRNSSGANQYGFNEEQAKQFSIEFKKFYQQIDSINTKGLKKIISVHGWPIISKFGKQAESDAWLIAQHADNDIAFQKEVLTLLEELLPANETNPSSYAYLFDRVAASYFDKKNRTLQRYGTQGECHGKNNWQPLPMEEPNGIDERRKTVGLGPMAEYKALVSQYCY